MNANELFGRLSPQLAHQIFEFLLTQDKASYKSALHTLAGQRKLRPVFLERKPKAERHIWMRDALARPQNEAIASNLIQIWLINARSEMLCDFLDALGIEHDEKGGIDTLPESPSKEALQAAIEKISQKYPREEILVYLHAFQSMDIAGWAPLQEILDKEFTFESIKEPSAA